MAQSDSFLKSIGKLLEPESIKTLALEYGLNEAVAKAIVEVEAQSRGFYAGTLIPVVRFENHIFSRETNGKYDKDYPELSSRKFTNTYNRVGIAEFNRFSKAATIDRTAAIRSTSWGLGQVMGFNHNLCGFSLEEFVEMQFISERTQLIVMFNFIERHNRNLIKIANSLDFATFAKYYNGANYAMNRYDVKLEQAYKKYVS